MSASGAAHSQAASVRPSSGRQPGKPAGQAPRARAATAHMTSSGPAEKDKAVNGAAVGEGVVCAHAGQDKAEQQHGIAHGQA